MLPTVIRRVPLAIFAGTLTAGSLSAQVSGLIWKATSAATSPNGQNATITVPEEQRITPATLDQLERGLAAQLAALNVAKQQPAGTKTPEASQQSQGQQMMSPEMQKVLTTFTDASTAADGNNEKTVQAAQKYQASMDSLFEAKYGRDPAKTQDRARDAARAAEAKGQKASGFSPTLWAIFHERMAPFCNLPAAKRGNGDVRAEGQYVYLKSEADALAPRCASIMAKLSATN
jgi:hypothetical protein